MHYKVVITDKDGTEVTFNRIVEKIVIDRRLDMQTASASIVIQNVKKRVPNLYSFTGMDGIVCNGNLVKIYISDDYRIDKIQFTGIIREFAPNDTDEYITINCHDIACRILRPIDGGIPYHIFDNIYATALISNLVQKAGVRSITLNINKANDYIVKNLKMQYDVQISDIIDQALATLEARARVLKDGTYHVEKLYPSYKKTDPDAGVNYDFLIEDFVKIGNIERKRNSATLYNRLLIRHKDNSYDVFEEPTMIKYVGYRIFKEIDAPIADTTAKRQKMANKLFLDYWRENTNLDAVMTKGNPNIDIGKIARLKLNNRTIGHYLITGVRTELTPDNYIDTLTLDGMRENVDIAQLSTGNYTLEKNNKSNNGNKKNKKETSQDAKENTIEQFKIDSIGKIKLGFVDIEKQPYLEVKAFFNSLIETKHYDLILQDPNKSYYGFKETILGNTENPAILTTISSCKSIEYSGWKAMPEYFRVTKPMPGRWYVYLKSDIKEDYKASISVNLPWKKVKI